MIFESGMKVECVEGIEDLFTGKIYTVREVVNFHGHSLVSLNEYIDTKAWFLWRFRPIKQRGTSIEIFREIVREVKQGASREIVDA
jgi:hypothetical protein